MLFFKTIFWIAILIFLWMFFSPSSLKSAIIGAPFVPTPKSIIRKALKAAGLKPGENLYDLGSGTGKVLIMAAREFGARATGFEYSFPFFLISRINLFINRVGAIVLRRNFFEENLKNADVVFLFLTPKAIAKLKEKFNRELKTGARVVAFSSPLLFWEPSRVILLPERKGKINLYLYCKK